MDNEAHAEQILKARCEAGDTRSCQRLILMLAPRSDRVGEAESLLRKLIAKLAGSEIELLASQLTSIGNIRLSEQAYRGAIAKGGGGARFQLALLLFAQPNRKSESDLLFKEVIESSTADELNTYGVTLANSGGWDEVAERMYQAATQKGNRYAWFNLANLLARQKRIQEAEQAYKAAIAGGLAIAHNNYGNLLSSQPGRGTEAEQAFLKAIAAGETKAYKNLANMIARQPGREKEAEELFKAAIAQGEKNAYVGLWQLLQRQPGREREAQEAEKNMMELLPGLVDRT
jgi:tetratricopeptide (TPR) repeat protein